MVAERSIGVDAAAIDNLVELGYDPALGARPLKRVIARPIQDPVAEAMLGNRYKNGYTIRIGVAPTE
jgi:ATP-dependent Clp protease ATP-binding subunit ClpA